MTTNTYIGTIVEERWGYRTDNGYEPSLSLECENGEDIALGNSNYNSYFADRIGTRVKLVIEELEQIEENDE